MPKPVIAAINGTCVGAGLGLALACDLRIAVTTARFGTAFAAIGLTCDSGMSATLVRAVGAARASELILRGDLFTAPEALAWGIVGAVAEPAEFPAAATALATRMAAGPTLAYAEIKRALATAWTLPFPEALAAEGAAQARLGLTQDHRDAVEAFLTKQSPTFHAH
jgi:2-(1,2-epoxy-1,2-dihydrophenyl)acetyl-CoA isomerase